MRIEYRYKRIERTANYDPKVNFAGDYTK